MTMFSRPICYTNSNRITIQYVCKILILFVLWSTAGAEDAENEEIEGLKIVSKTELHSAKFNMGISKDSKEDDLKRQTIGVGETITISLEAKPALMGDPKKLEWIVTDEEGVLILPEKMKGITSFDAQAKPTAEKNGQVTVTVKTEGGLVSKPYSLKIVIPEGAKVQKLKEGQDTPPQIQEQMPGVPFASAWMIIQLTIHPLDVNFSKMKIKEIDEGYVNPQHNKNNRPPHNPNPKPVEIQQTNQFKDEIALDLPITKDQLNILDKENPMTWGHKCWFRLVSAQSNGNDPELCAGVARGIMNCSISKTNKDITIEIDKFHSEKNPVMVQK
uniref:hypothetical protein n=1 Tax=Akkermansia sp. TaxID=1872421 RepID=UPI003AAF7BE9